VALGPVGLMGATAGATTTKNTTGPPCAPPPATTAAMANSTTGVTSKTITVGNVSILTGPVPGLFKGAPTGVKAYFNYINSQGGVNGHKLAVDSYDDGFSGAQNAQETQQAVQKDFALVGNFSLFDSYGCKILSANPAVPDVSVTLDPGTNSLPNDFSAQPLAPGLAANTVAYIKQKYPKDTTVGAVVSNAATSIAEWNGQKAALEKLGYKIGYVDEVNPLQSDYTTDVINMKNKGVNFLWMTDLDWQVGADIMQNLAQQGWKPAVIFSGGPIYTPQFIKAAGGASVVNGIWLGQVQDLYLGQDAKTNPAVKTFDTWVHKTDPSWSPDIFTLYGWASAQMFVQALKAAGPNPTRGAVLAQLKKITSFSPSGLIAPSNPAGKQPPTCVLIAQVRNGTFVRVHPAKSGFACGGSYLYGPLSSS
jgi:ABC-type branched-subunit amino acid transport system substrate-binding protein